MKILDIGCGHRKFESLGDEVTGLDIQKLSSVDVVADMEKPLPFPDKSFDMVRSNHSLEHIRNRLQLIDEIWRVLKPDGLFVVAVPHFSNPAGRGTDHYGYFGMTAFDPLTYKENEHYIRGKFELLERHVKMLAPFGFLAPLAERFPNFYEWRLTWLLPMVDVSFRLRKIGEIIDTAPKWSGMKGNNRRGAGRKCGVGHEELEATNYRALKLPKVR